MEFFQTIDFNYSISGFIVGVLVGLTGVGGGSLMTPLLVLLFGFHPSTAVGTDLLFASVTKTGGTLVHNLSGSVDWRVVRRLAAGSIPATLVALALLYQLGADSPEVSKIITLGLGIALFFTAFALFFQSWFLDAHGHRMSALPPKRVRMLTIALGAVVGFLVTFTSVGAGAIGVTALVFLYPKMPMARIVGSDIAHAVPLTLIAGLGHWSIGSVDWHLFASLAVGSLPGIVVGSAIAPRIYDGILRVVLGIVLIFVAGRLFLV